jgi:Tfp pilus assembly protein PilO
MVFFFKLILAYIFVLADVKHEEKDEEKKRKDEEIKRIVEENKKKDEEIKSFFKEKNEIQRRYETYKASKGI